MKNYQNPKPSVIAERFRFNKRDRKQGERIVQYVAQLRRLTEYCDYGTSLKNIYYVIDWFVVFSMNAYNSVY